MTRFINSTLIGLVAFFLFLAVLWLFVDPAAPGLATNGDPPDSDVSIEAVEADWAPGDPTRLLVEVTLENEGKQAASISQVAYRTMLDDQLLAAASEDPPTQVPAGSQAPMRFTVSLPPDFAARWMEAYAAGGESSRLRVDGSILVRTATDDARLPFEWQSSWRGQLLDRLRASPQECPGPPAPLCLESIDPAFRDGDLRVKVGLRNDRAEPLVVRNGTFRLVFEDMTVATGRLGETFEIAPGGDQQLPATLAFDDAALVAWWGGHVARCESSRLSLNIGLEVEQGMEGGAALVDWDILAAPLMTGFLCDRSA